MDSNREIQPPRMLKDFLHDQTLTLPRRSTIAVFLHAAVTSVKSPSLFRRFSRSKFTRKLSRRHRLPEPTMDRSTSVTVKDILRWRSFRDVAETEANLAAASPSRFTNTTTATTMTTPRSSWCDSDFTVGDSPVWCRGFSGDGEGENKRNFRVNVVGGERVRGSDPKDQLPHNEEEQYSPISVLDFTSQEEDEETRSSFSQTLANIERTNFTLKQRIQEFENLIEVEDHCLVNKSVEVCRVEEQAIQLVDLVKVTNSIEECEADVDYLLLDFFRDELITDIELNNNGQCKLRMLRAANAWLRGEDDGSLEWDLHGTKDVCIRDMEQRGRWNNFDADRPEIGIEITAMVFDHLLNELSLDFHSV